MGDILENKKYVISPCNGTYKYENLGLILFLSIKFKKATITRNRYKYLLTTLTKICVWITADSTAPQSSRLVADQQSIADND